MKKYLSFIYLSIICFANYFGLIYLKYTLNNFSIFEFNIASFGNFIYVINFAATFIFLLLLKIKNNSLYNKNIIQIYGIVFLSIVVFFLLVISINNNSYWQTKYLWGYPIKRISIAFLFTANFWLLLYLLFVAVLFNFASGIYVYLKSFAYSSLFIGSILIISFFYSLTFVNSNLGTEKHDLGVVLGAAVWKGDKPSPILLGRIHKAYDLYKSNNLKRILVIGGNAPGELTEAEVSYRNLLKLGVKKEDIKIEKNTSTTVEQVKYIKINEFLSGSEKIIIISDQFHLKRVLEICKFFNIKAIGIASDTKYVFKKLLFYRVRESVALLLFWLFAI